VDDTTTTFTVVAVSGWPSSFPYTLIIDQDTANEEVVTVTNRSGTTLTVTRAQDGTSAVAHSAGAAVNHGVSARDFDEPNDHVNDNTTDVHDQYVLKGVATAKGDILAASGNAAVDNLAVGSDNTVLIADSGETLGIKWDVLSSEQIPTAGINTQTGTTYTFATADAGKFVTFGASAATTATVPTNASVAFSTGTVINLVQLGAGEVTVSGASGVTVSATDSATKLAAQYAAAQLLKTATDDWVLIGNITA
jgi:hypothetical protein